LSITLDEKPQTKYPEKPWEVRAQIKENENPEEDGR
jgi:hypothetical protein